MNLVIFGNACGFGGAQTAFRRLVGFAIQEGHSVGVVGIGGSKDKFPAVDTTGAFFTRLDSNFSAVRKMAGIGQAILAARRFSPDVFISVGLARSACLIARFVPRKTFRVCLDFIFGRPVNDPLLVSSTLAFDALAVQAPSMVESLRNKGFKGSPLSWLPCFPEAPVPGFRQSERGARRDVRLAYFGRLAPNKGIDYLLRALVGTNFSAPVSLDIWGSGNELGILEQIVATNGLNGLVSFRGRYPEGEAYARLLCGYDGIVLPSKDLEGLPLILLECMSYGVPFLTTRVGAIPDCCVNNEDAVLVNSNQQELCAGLQTFVSRIRLSEFSTSRLINYYQTNFSFSVMASRWRSMLANPCCFFKND